MLISRSMVTRLRAIEQGDNSIWLSVAKEVRQRLRESYSPAALCRAVEAAIGSLPKPAR